jgi:hypothetical protein
MIRIGVVLASLVVLPLVFAWMDKALQEHFTGEKQPKILGWL